jgi:hypothetical protein
MSGSAGPRIFRESDWVDDIGRGSTTVTVVVNHPGVEHKVRVRDFEQWLGRKVEHQ